MKLTIVYRGIKFATGDYSKISTFIRFSLINHDYFISLCCQGVHKVYQGASVALRQ